MNNNKPALLIEDNPMIRCIHQRYLEKLGFIVDQASSQLQALTQAFNQRYRLILTDLGLPDSQNETIISQLRSTFSLNQRTSLVVVTAHHNACLIRRCLKAGAQAVLSKPLCPDQLAELIHTFEHNKTNLGAVYA